MPSQEFTPNTVWGSNEPVAGHHELTLPSGQTCRAKKIGMEGLLEMGILDQADSLTAMAERFTKTEQKSGPNGPATAKVDEGAILADPGALKAIISLVDRALPIIVLSPPVALHYKEQVVGKTKVTKMLDDRERAEMREARNQLDLVFTDQVGFEDKMFLFDWAAGGLSSLVPFRRESSANVLGVDDVPRLSRPTKRPSRRK